jgi:hypothetical protein
MTKDVVSRDEVRSVMSARNELGDEMEPALIDAFVARIEPRLADRAEWARTADGIGSLLIDREWAEGGDHMNSGGASAGTGAGHSRGAGRVGRRRSR